jgi:hypothetical protein
MMTDTDRDLIRATIEFCETTIRFVYAHGRDDDVATLDDAVSAITKSRELLHATATAVTVH